MAGEIPRRQAAENGPKVKFYKPLAHWTVQSWWVFEYGKCKINAKSHYLISHCSGWSLLLELIDPSPGEAARMITQIKWTNCSSPFRHCSLFTVIYYIMISIQGEISLASLGCNSAFLGASRVFSSTSCYWLRIPSLNYFNLQQGIHKWEQH